MISDVLDGLKRVPSNSVNLIVTSPPYNLGFNYGEGIIDEQPWSFYYSWCHYWLSECFRVLTPDGRIAINHYFSCGSAKAGRSAPLMELNTIMQKIGFKHHAVAFWPDATVSRLTAWGSWMKASAPYINSPYEGILIMYKNQWKRLKKGISTITKEEFIKSVSGVWNISPEKKKNVNHPAAFPVGLPKRCIELLTYEGDIVLDPFMGSGTVGVASVQTKRNFIGIEKNATYAKDAKRRIYKEIKK